MNVQGGGCRVNIPHGIASDNYRNLLVQYSKQSFFLVGIMVDILSVKSLPSLFPANYCLALYIRTYICMYIFGLKRVPVLHMPSPASQPSLIGVEQSLYQLLAPVVGWLYSMCACWTASTLHSFITGLPQQTGLAHLGSSTLD